MRTISPVWILFLVFAWTSCAPAKEEKNNTGTIHFTSLPASATKIDFNNTITEDDSVNLIYNAYAYMGSGVGIGDFNNDGLQDIFFGANQQSSKLYINKGNITFEDITAKAGVQTDYWVTGISVVDINNDGYDDIYVCASGTSGTGENRRNRLYINQKDLSFKEEAAAYGLADTLYATQAAFFDYDKDGDLDMYLVNHLLNHQQSNSIVAPDRTGKATANDKLYRNTGIAKGTDHPYFEEVSVAAGIKEDGYGLGLVICDANNDSWPDLYVTNDYLANDLLWINNKNGTFTNTVARSLRHQSYSSMGVDAADINNDGLTDIMSLDMQPEDNRRKKLMFSFLNYERYILERKAGYEPEFMRNMLQLNNGVIQAGDTAIPFFSEIGQLAGISETDWSWSVLMADFDNDGWKDIHVTNGLGRDMIHSDFINFWASASGTGYRDWREQYKAILKKLDEYGTVELNNYCFKNKGDLRFENVTQQAGLNSLSISNGCAYADLDNDGDLDLVVSNINKTAFILKNDAVKPQADSAHHYITITLSGDSLNKNGFGSKLQAYTASGIYTGEQHPVRGYLSTVDKRIHMGCGKAAVIDSLRITWPDGKQQLLINLATDTMIALQQKAATVPGTNITAAHTPSFTAITGNRGLEYVHKEQFFYDFGVQQLLPQKYSQLGPFITEGDMNGDGLVDFFIGGAAGQSGQLFFQQADGRFLQKALVTGNKPQEDLGVLLFDADGDKDLDLFINSGGYEYGPGSASYLPRLYLNDSKGNFTFAEDALPKTIFTSAQCVTGADYDGDGDIDLFVGGRISPRQYPVIPQSYILRNDGGRFSIVTEEVCAALQYAGMITAAVWTDINNDAKPDLVIAGEWMPVRFFENRNGKLEETTSTTGIENSYGQWRSLVAADIDKDGDIDFVAGNLGLNNKYKTSPEHPIRLFARDIDGNGSIDPVMAYHLPDENGKPDLYPAINRDQFSAQVPAVKKRFLYHTDFAKVNIATLFSDEEKEDMLQMTCNQTASVWIENRGKGKFEMHLLPVEAQFAPINAIVVTDSNGDGNADILIAGNEYQADVMTGRYDASYGLLLTGNGKGNFSPVTPVNSGLILDGDIKDLKIIITQKKEKLLLAATNDAPLQVFLIK